MTDEPEKRPSHIAYQVRKGSDGQSHFNRIGVGFENKDGEGINVIMSAQPIDGRLTLRTVKDRLEQAKSSSEKGSERGQDEYER